MVKLPLTVAPAVGLENVIVPAAVTDMDNISRAKAIADTARIECVFKLAT
jgi:hypothetical protein